MTVRHDWLVELLAKFFRSAQAIVHIEPRIYDSDRLRPDLDIMFPNRRILVDVTIVHPTSPSRTSRIELSAAAAAEAQKTRQYSALARNHGASLLALAMESYGAFGKEATELMRILMTALDSNSSFNISQAVNCGYPVQAISVALQRGNCLVMSSGALDARAVELAQ